MPSRDPYSKKSAFYDLDQVKQIPIQSVCSQMLGIPVERRNGRAWCKARIEENASTLLHEDRNTFYDFGTNEHGDVIHFVSYVLGVSWKEALLRLAEEYHIPAQNTRQGLTFHDLSLWEYEKIGLSGDLATKNFQFDEHLSTQRMGELHEKYAMSISQLRKKHPKIYERLLRQKSLPYVSSLRRDYYLEVWRKHLLMKEMGCPQLFHSKEIQEELGEKAREVEVAEGLLLRALKGTSIKGLPPREYDPEEDLILLKEGKVKPSLGPIPYKTMQLRSEQKNSRIIFRGVEYLPYAVSGLEKAPHCAFFSAGQVIVGYLEKDAALVRPTLDKVSREKPKERKPSLKEQISEGEERKSQVKPMAAPTSSQKEH